MAKARWVIQEYREEMGRTSVPTTDDGVLPMDTIPGIVMGVHPFRGHRSKWVCVPDMVDWDTLPEGTVVGYYIRQADAMVLHKCANCHQKHPVRLTAIRRV